MQQQGGYASNVFARVANSRPCTMKCHWLDLSLEPPSKNCCIGAVQPEYLTPVIQIFALRSITQLGDLSSAKIVMCFSFYAK